jgi:hypothetical protein
MTALISKPGLTSASALSIPTAWSQSWFRGFINSYLTGGDVRNAVGKNGIVVSGTLASPYATISLGGTGAITLTNDVTITPASGVGLTVNAASGQYGAVFNGSANLYAVEIFGNSTTGESYGLYIEAGTNASDVAFRVDTYTMADVLVIEGNGAVEITAPVTISAPGSDVALTISGSNLAPSISVGSGNTGGCGLYNASTAIPSVVMNSSGSDYGMIQSTASQIWSLAAGTSNIANGTAVISWGPAAAYFPGVGTTASAANAFLNSASSPVNQLLRSTSSLRYKTNVQSIQPTDINAVLQMRPVTYTSLAPADNPATVYLGFIAEEMALIDPRLVQYTSSQTQNGVPVANAPLVPDSVMYDRVVTLLVGAVQTLAQRVAQIEATAASMVVVPPTATLSLAGTYSLTGTNVVATPSVVTVLPPTIPTPVPTKGENIP